MEAGKFSFKFSRQTQKNLVGSSKYAYFFFKKQKNTKKSTFFDPFLRLSRRAYSYYSISAPSLIFVLIFLNLKSN
jgi:hypothetical protein